MLLEKFLELYDDFVATPFPTSAEGDTGAGGHEAAVAAYFISKGFALINSKKGANAKGDSIFIMNKESHSPNKVRTIEKEGYFTILQPYSIARGSFNPAPDLYLVEIKGHTVINWLGIECKSSKGNMWPTWNDKLPRPYRKGNIIYFLTGGNKKAGGAGNVPKNRNMIFTAEAFFGLPEEETATLETNIKELFNEVKKFFQTTAIKNFPALAGKLKFDLRQKIEQMHAISEDEIVEFTALTKEFLTAHLAAIRSDGAGAPAPEQAVKTAIEAGKEVSNSNTEPAIGRERGGKLRFSAGNVRSANAVAAIGGPGAGTKKKKEKKAKELAAAAIGGPGGAGAVFTSKGVTAKKKRPGNNNNNSNYNPNNND